MIQLQLSQGQVATIDDCDAHLAEHKWFFNQGYAARQIRDNGKKLRKTLHREIMNAPTGVMVEFIDGNPMNCRRSNLRLATEPITYKALCWNGKSREWLAYLPPQKYLGSFKTPEEAVNALTTYDEASR